MNTQQLYERTARQLLDKRNENGYWTGQLSSSALSTAVAIVALKIHDKSASETQVEASLSWLYQNVNSNGGFGDTPESESNVSTSLLSYGAIYFCGENTVEQQAILTKIERYLSAQGIELTPDSIVSNVLNFYGKDLTFSVPILSFLVICGLVEKQTFDRIPQLPFELMVLPHGLYQFFNLQVVSYALPALVAVGICIFKGRTKRTPVWSWVRNRSMKPALQKLEQMLPESGGFLEAIPLTAFVNLCLIYSETDCGDVVPKGIEFLYKQQRPDGSWPIDTDLSNWVTTLSIKAFGKAKLQHHFSKAEIDQLRQHLLGLQYKETHPFNRAKAGGWGWTTFSGSVPDADDTPGAILALHACFNGSLEEKRAIAQGCKWLIDLQNSDGGLPTFSKGWGRLPFDSSCADLSGHAFLAIGVSLELLDGFLSISEEKLFRKSLRKLLNYLKKHQLKDGSWLPLWFGNQQNEDKQNPVYGTAKVSTYLSDALELNIFSSEDHSKLKTMVEKAQQFLLKQQNEDGSWGGAKNISGTIEESALAIGALASSANQEVCLRAVSWIENKIENDGFQANPIGLYFASLWYDEELYPYVFYLEALRRITKR